MTIEAERLWDFETGVDEQLDQRDLHLCSNGQGAV
jgi:hypothetical protein